MDQRYFGKERSEYVGACQMTGNDIFKYGGSRYEYSPELEMTDLEYLDKFHFIRSKLFTREILRGWFNEIDSYLSSTKPRWLTTSFQLDKSNCINFLLVIAAISDHLDLSTVASQTDQRSNFDEVTFMTGNLPFFKLMLNRMSFSSRYDPSGYRGEIAYIGYLDDKPRIPLSVEPAINADKFSVSVHINIDLENPHATICAVNEFMSGRGPLLFWKGVKK